MASMAEQIYTAGRSTGISDSDLDVLIGIAKAESDFDPRAVGDQDLPTGPRYGLFQKEREQGVTIPNQISAAHTLLTVHRGELRPLTDMPHEHLIAASWPDSCRYLRAAWQRRDGSLRRWLADIEKRWNGARLTVQMLPGASGAAGDIDQMAQALLMKMNPFDEGDRERAWEMRLDIADFIEFSGREGANVDALESGQGVFGRYMEKHGWHPAAKLSGDYERGAGASIDDVFGTGADAAHPPWVPGGGGLASTMSWIWNEIRGGLKSFGKGALSTLLPIAGILVVGGLTYSAIKRFISGVPTEDES